MPLDTLELVKTRVGISGTADDALLNLLLESATAWIQQYCQRDFAGGDFSEDHPGNSEFVHVRQFPIAEVERVLVDPQRHFGAETVWPSTAYVVHSERGVIQSVVGPFVPNLTVGFVQDTLRTWTAEPKVVRVEYSTLTVVPDDVLAAFARLVAAWYRQVKTDTAANFLNVAQQKIGDAFVIYRDMASDHIPADVTALLTPYRVPLV